MGLMIKGGTCDSCGRRYELHVSTGDEPIVEDGRCQECFDKDKPRTAGAINSLWMSIPVVLIIVWLIIECINRFN